MGVYVYGCACACVCVCVCEFEITPIYGIELTSERLQVTSQCITAITSSVPAAFI